MNAIPSCTRDLQWIDYLHNFISLNRRRINRIRHYDLQPEKSCVKLRRHIESRLGQGSASFAYQTRARSCLHMRTAHLVTQIRFKMATGGDQQMQGDMKFVPFSSYIAKGKGRLARRRRAFDQDSDFYPLEHHAWSVFEQSADSLSLLFFGKSKLQGLLQSLHGERTASHLFPSISYVRYLHVGYLNNLRSIMKWLILVLMDSCVLVLREHKCI